MASTDLLKFLTDRLNEDEATARGLLNAAVHLGAKPNFYNAGGPAAEAYWQHFDTGRMLADTAAKRALVDHFTWVINNPDQVTYGGPARIMLERLAEAYKHHPDYRRHWAP